MASGIGTVIADFGSGTTDVQVSVTGQTNIGSASETGAWINPTTTSNNGVDEHWLENLEVTAGPPTPGVGFTIYVKCTSGIAYGQYSIAWAWTTTGSVYNPVLSVAVPTTTYSMASSDDLLLCNATSGSFVVNLPDVTSTLVKKYDIKKIDSSSNTITITRSGTSLIDGQTTYVLNLQYQSITLVPDGTNWNII